ncbi:MAG: hypothetical protein LAN84_15505 [Acidobacteriia bacterium]|nr:hypothetical protein [Terriglobia bacterium]
METGPVAVATQGTLLALDLPERQVSWRNSRGEARLHTFRRIGAEFWNGYFSRIAVESDRTSRTIDVSSAALWLYREAILRVAGISVRGGGNLTDLPNWQERIPMGLRLQAIGLLSSVEASAEDIVEIEPECEVVRLDALWNDDGAYPGAMTKFEGLVHRFTPPTAAHQQRFSREISRSVIVGGSREGKTIHPVRQKVLVKFYDELILSVEGYGVNGAPLAHRDNIVREMDLLHKVTAAAQLLSMLGEGTAEEGAEE